MLEIKKVYGPYLIKKESSSNFGRKQVIVCYVDGSRRTMLLSRHLMEQNLSRRLDPDETVDHIDRDKTNDVIENLRIVSRSKHVEDDTVRVRLVDIVCVWCGKTSAKHPRQLDGNAKKGKAGPFCDKKCSGEYGASLQNGKVEKLEAQPDNNTREYFYNEKN